MEFNFVPLTLAYVEEIKKWQYKGYVKDIYMEPYIESYEKTGIMRGPDGCEGYAALQKNKLAGLFEYYFRGSILEIGLALSPELVGKGLGKDFVNQGIDFGLKQYSYGEKHIKLTVNINNKPALSVYQKAGFSEYIRRDEEVEMRKVLYSRAHQQS